MAHGVVNYSSSTTVSSSEVLINLLTTVVKYLLINR